MDKNTKHNGKYLKWIVVIGFLIAVIAMWISKSRREYIVQCNNILMEDCILDFSRDAQKVFGSDILREEILTITFLDTKEGAPEHYWDVSQNKDETVIAWVTENNTYYETYYDLYIAAEGKIYAPESCNRLFYEYSNVEKIQFNRNFDTRFVTDMYGMFYACGNLKELDVSDFDTSNVTHMNEMFSMCINLRKVDISDFDMSGVTGKGSMFFGCVNLPAKYKTH